MSLHFIKELPQKRHGNQVKLDEIATALKARPAEWAAIRTYPKPRRKSAYTYISNVRRGKVKALDPKQGFEFQVISEPTKTVVYARYIKAT
jgi:hypothetical protein